MSRREGSHEGLDATGNLDEFESVLAALRPRVESGTAAPVIGSPIAGGHCEHAVDHSFVCLHCGIDLPRAGRFRRWAWPAATAAATSIAVALLVMIAVEHSGDVADHRPAVSSSSTTAQSREGDNRKESSGRSLADDVPFSLSPRLLLERSVPRDVLSAADLELRYDLLASANQPASASQNGTDSQPAEPPLGNATLVRGVVAQ